MATTAMHNPTINPPHLASSRRSLHSRSPSRSPVRQHDPLLRDLSPSKTSRAFATPSDASHDATLIRSIQNASPSQRALGGKVAQACADLKTWTRELESWEWPGTFDMPEPARKKQRMSDMTTLSRSESEEQKHDEQWGSLPASVVEGHEQRVEEICVAFDEINFEELKSFVLSAHSQAGVGEASIDDSIGTIGAATDLKRLDDFTALITATILQALPYLPKLTRLLDSWTTRLSILRSTPKYLRDLKKARTDLDHGWAALAISAKSSDSPSLTSESLEDMKNVISHQLYSLGKRLDRFLDMLEGRPEVVPDAWIDDFEDLEEGYGEWVVKAERKVLEGEWKSIKQQSRETAIGLVKEDERNGMVGSKAVEDVAAAPRDVPPLTPQKADRGITTITTPTITTQSVMDDEGNYFATSSPTHRHTITAPTVSTTVTSAAPSNNISKSPRTSKGSASPSRPRHVPIVVGYSHPDEPSDFANITALPQTGESDSQSISRTKSRTPTERSNGPSTSNVKERAAFLNGDIERRESLIKSKSAPIVRPFEHASNAFTRLFKKQSRDLGEVRDNHAAVVDEANKRSIKDESKSNQRISTASASGSSGKVSSSASNKNRRMEYMDMVRAPSEPRPKSQAQSVEKPRSRGRSEKRERMAYGDLVMAVKDRVPKDFKPSKKSEQSESMRTRASERAVSAGGKPQLSERSSSRTPKKRSGNQRIAMDLAGPSVARKSDEFKRAKLSATPRDEFARLASAPAVPLLERRSFDESHWQHGSAAKQKRESRELTALPQPSYIADGRSTSSKGEWNAPETYRPSGFGAATSSEDDQFPANWPLANTASDAGVSADDHFIYDSEWAPEWARKTSENNEPIASDDFEEFFVRTLPQKTGIRQKASSSRVTAERGSGFVGSTVRSSSAPGSQPREYRVITEQSPPRRDIRSSKSRSAIRPVSVVQEEDLSDDDADGMLSDNAAGYFGSQGSKRSRSMPPSKGQKLKVRIPDVPEIGGVSQTAEPDEGIIRRASTASIGSYPRDQVKSIELPRKSVEASATEPQTPQAQEPFEEGPNSAMNFNGVGEFPSPPTVPRRRSSMRSSISSVQSSTPAQQVPMSSQDAAPLNAAMPKQRSAQGPTNRNLVGKETGSRSEKSSPLPLKPGEDQFDRQVSEVLDRVHAPIKFKARPGAVTPVTKTPFEQRMKARAERQGKNMELIPAEPSPKKSTSADPQVKLYHLTQAGRSEPIKLFVRLVGENSERVMVRVGGGWADLADYLRTYAEHHGSRTVSEGAVELQTADAIPGLGTSGSTGKRAFSGPAFAIEPKSRSPITPTIGKTVSPAVTTTTTTTSSNRPGESLKTQTMLDFGSASGRPRLWLGDDSDNDEDQLSSPLSSTPRSAKTTSRPSTANAAPRPDSRSGPYDASSPVSPGLGGKVRTELPEQKAKWVEGMIEKAMKSASAATAANPSSAEGSKEDREKYFGEMGKVGATRRVVFRQAEKAEMGAK